MDAQEFFQAVRDALARNHNGPEAIEVSEQSTDFGAPMAVLTWSNNLVGVLAVAIDDERNRPMVFIYLPSVNPREAQQVAQGLAMFCLEDLESYDYTPHSVDLAVADLLATFQGAAATSEAAGYSIARLTPSEREPMQQCVGFNNTRKLFRLHQQPDTHKIVLTTWTQDGRSVRDSGTTMFAGNTVRGMDGLKMLLLQLERQDYRAYISGANNPTLDLLQRIREWSF
jgi:hypothetical protein